MSYAFTSTSTSSAVAVLPEGNTSAASTATATSACLLPGRANGAAVTCRAISETGISPTSAVATGDGSDRDAGFRAGLSALGST